MMTLGEILTELVGFYDYETGGRDSGVHDPLRRDQLRMAYAAMLDNDVRAAEAEWYRDYWLSDEAIAKGYGIEDLFEFLKWLENDL